MQELIARPGAEYAERVAAGEVPYQRCTACGQAIFSPRVLCTNCGSTALAWEGSGGHGTVYSATTVFLRNVDPYTVGLIDLDEGIRVMTRIDDAVAGEPPIGRPVQVSVGELDGAPVLRARLSEATADA